MTKLPEAVSLGRRGGQKTFKRYGKEKMKEWGLRGGRPKKKPVDNLPLAKKRKPL
jgi:general stress protein YciG